MLKQLARDYTQLPPLARFTPHTQYLLVHAVFILLFPTGSTATVYRIAIIC
nr:MAG TPA: hypothetical protein [Caudoviricetes sp.]